MGELRLILGRAGTGKTLTVHDEMLKAVALCPQGPPLWLMTPEQATFQAERDLSSRSENGGIMRIRVTSFRRLAHHVSQMVGGSTLRPLSPLGRQMLVRRIIEDNRSALMVFSRAARQPGFCLRLVELLAEMKRYGIRPEQLQSALESGAGMTATLAGKLHDLHLILSQAEAKYSALGLLDGEDVLDRLADQVRDFTDFTDAQIWLDGFTGFTPQEYTVLARMISVASQVTVTLTMPPETLDLNLCEESPFFTPWETARHLVSEFGAVAGHLSVLGLTAELRFADQGPLAHVADSYHDMMSLAYTGPLDDRVRLVAAANRRVEVEAATREIIRLCRDRGYRYRDLCLIVRDFSLYEDLISVVFRDHEVPFFMDRKRPVPHHPLLDLLRAAIDCVLSDWSYDPVMRCLKTDLFPLTSHEVDHLDNFALAKGIRGRRWFSEDAWPPSGPGDDSVAIDTGRRAVAHFLHPLIEAFDAANAGVMAAALAKLLDDLRVEETMQLWRVQAQESGDLEAAGLHPQVYRSICELLTELEGTLGGEQMGVEAFAKTLATGLEGISLGLVPVGLDQVLVVAMGRSRSPDVKVALLLGANEGVFPARPPIEGILSDEDRQYLNYLQITLGPTATARVFEEEHLVYTALTRASDRLYVSFAQSTDDGSPLLPSAIIRRLKELLPALATTHVEHEPRPDQDDLTDWIVHPYSTAGL
ncbi:MAG TPA: helicase-exonuclease AddAB subunit AddB, partial [Bacillota bacterium]|nr:helicase-exonuclease AddAB subunit AddB [Bacillota bacterium]